MLGAWSRPPAPRASRPRRPRAGGRDRGELPGRAQHLRKLAEKFENEKSNRLSASALPMTLQPRTAPVLKSEMLTLMPIIKESKFSEELPPAADSFPQPLPGVGISYLYRTMYHIEKFCLFPSKPLHRLSDLPVPDKGCSCRGRTSVSGGRR
ncbi:hypothetical protein R6Z07F_003934 [Ovis aries]